MIDPSQFYQKIETRGWHSGSLFIRDRHIEVSRQQLELVCDKIRDNLHIIRSSSPNIINTIELLRFSLVIQLSLEGNGIESVESLHLIFMPQLQNLKLNNNYITTIKSLGRCLYLKLKSINLSQNHIMDTQLFTSVKMNEGFEALDISKNGGQNLIVKDVNWMAKIEPKLIYKIRYTNPRNRWGDSQLNDVIGSRLDKISEKFALQKIIRQ